MRDLSNKNTHQVDWILNISRREQSTDNNPLRFPLSRPSEEGPEHTRATTLTSTATLTIKLL